MTNNERAAFIYSLSASLMALSNLPKDQSVATQSAIDAAIAATVVKATELTKNIH